MWLLEILKNLLGKVGGGHETLEVWTQTAMGDGPSCHRAENEGSRGRERKYTVSGGRVLSPRGWSRDGAWRLDTDFSCHLLWPTLSPEREPGTSWSWIFYKQGGVASPVPLAAQTPCPHNWLRQRRAGRMDIVPSTLRVPALQVGETLGLNQMHRLWWVRGSCHSSRFPPLWTYSKGTALPGFFHDEGSGYSRHSGVTQRSSGVSLTLRTPCPVCAPAQRGWALLRERGLWSSVHLLLSCCK